MFEKNLNQRRSIARRMQAVYFWAWNESFAIEWYVSIFEFCINLSVNCFLIHWTHSTLDSSSEEDFQNEKNELK